MEIMVPIFVISGLGIVFGLGLSYASKVFAVPVDERVSRVRELLPGANCGACGFSGCDGLAEAIVNDGAPAGRCPVGGAAMVSAVSEVMGVEEGSVEVTVARVICQGDSANTGRKYNYDGIEDCNAANLLAAGMNACAYGCLGLGSCSRVCPFDAIVVENGLARVLPDKCTGCGKCVNICPKGIIKQVPVLTGFTVTCASQEKGGIARKQCKTACIGCQKCVRVCPSNAVTVENNVARIDAAKCINCGQCSEVCPQKCIGNYMAKRLA